MKKLKLAAMFLAIVSAITALVWFVFPALPGGFTAHEAASIAIIGGADGPTAIYTTSKMAPHAVAVMACFVVSLVAWLALHIISRKK